MAVPPGEVLINARAAAKAGDHESALANYEHFFDNALRDQGDDDNYYGVRLSYCLIEWAKLGEKYPEARRRLEGKAEQALAELQRTRNPALFHDLISINEYLGRDAASIDQFLKFHTSDRPLAESVVGYIWDDLVDGRQWVVCASYLQDPEVKYARALEKFDVTTKLCNDDPALGGNRLARQIAGWYVTDVSNLCLVLKNVDEMAAFDRIIDRMRTDMSVRLRPDLADEVGVRVSIDHLAGSDGQKSTSQADTPACSPRGAA